MSCNLRSPSAVCRCAEVHAPVSSRTTPAVSCTLLPARHAKLLSCTLRGTELILPLCLARDDVCCYLWRRMFHVLIYDCSQNVVDATSYFELEVRSRSFLLAHILHASSASACTFCSALHHTLCMMQTPPAKAAPYRKRTLIEQERNSLIISTVQAEEYSRKGVTLTPELWLVRFFLP